MSKPTGCSKMVEGPSIISKQSHGESAHVDFIIFESIQAFYDIIRRSRRRSMGVMGNYISKWNNEVGNDSVCRSKHKLKSFDH